MAVTLVFEIFFQLQRMTRELAVRNESQEGLLLSHHILEQPIVIVFKGYIYGAILYITRYTYSKLQDAFTGVYFTRLTMSSVDFSE